MLPAIRRGVACGSANVLTLSTGTVIREDVERLESEVKVLPKRKRWEVLVTCDRFSENKLNFSKNDEYKNTKRQLLSLAEWRPA